VILSLPAGARHELFVLAWGPPGSLLAGIYPPRATGAAARGPLYTLVGLHCLLAMLIQNILVGWYSPPASSMLRPFQPTLTLNRMAMVTPLLTMPTPNKVWMVGVLALTARTAHRPSTAVVGSCSAALPFGRWALPRGGDLGGMSWAAYIASCGEEGGLGWSRSGTPQDGIAAA